MVNVDSSFAWRLRSLLTDRDMSQAELARRVGMSRSTLNKVVNGKRSPNAREAGAIAHELEVDLLELIGVTAILAAQEGLVFRLQAIEERAEQAELDRDQEAEARSKVEASSAARVAELETQVRVTEDRAEKAKRERNSETEARAMIEASSAERIAKLEARAREADRRTREAEQARERETGARLRAEASSAEQIARLETELSDAVCAREAHQRESCRLRKKLEKAEELVAMYEVLDKKYPRKKTPSSRRPIVTPVVINDRHTATQAKVELWTAVASSAVKVLGGTLLYWYFSKRGNGDPQPS